MILLTTFRAPGTGRRQADPLARLAAENQRLLMENGQLYAGLRQTASVLGEYVVLYFAEQAAHAATTDRLDTAVRQNESNLNAKTVQTDVTMLRALHAAQADVVPADYTPQPERRPYWRLPAAAIRVMPLWMAPFATKDPADTRRLFTPAGAR